MRNLGGAVGLALINTLLDKRMDLHLERLRESVTWSRPAAVERLESMTAALAARGSDAELAATKALALIVRRQAEVLALATSFSPSPWSSSPAWAWPPSCAGPAAEPAGAGGNRIKINTWLSSRKSRKGQKPAVQYSHFVWAESP